MSAEAVARTTVDVKLEHALREADNDIARLAEGIEAEFAATRARLAANIAALSEGGAASSRDARPVSRHGARGRLADAQAFAAGGHKG